MKRFLILLIIPAFFLAACKKNTGKENSPTYAITVTYDENGTASADKQTAKKGETVTLTASPADGYELEKWTVESGDVTIRDAEVNSATFTMPAGDVSVRASFSLIPLEDIFTAITDPAFKQYCERFDTDGDGILSPDEAAAVSRIDLQEVRISDVASLEGIRYFINLEFLNCISNQLTSLDLSSNTQLTLLYCHSNHLASLDVSSNTQLTELYCCSNQMESLNVSGNTQLTRIDCYINRLASLDLSNCPQLSMLYCNSNLLTEIIVWDDFDLENPTNSIKYLLTDDGVKFVKK